MFIAVLTIEDFALAAFVVGALVLRADVILWKAADIILPIVSSKIPALYVSKDL